MANIIAIRRGRDPTGCNTIIKRFIADINNRFAKIKKEIKKFIVDEDCFGLKEVVANESGIFKYRTSQQKIDGFMTWLQKLEDEGLVNLIYRPRYGGANKLSPWIDVYIEDAYRKGIANTRKAANKSLKNIIYDDNVLKLAFFQPIHFKAVEILFTRVFTDLKGVTKVMDAQISRVLADGMIRGLNPEQLSKLIADRVDKIGRTRARLIARTETIRAHNLAAIEDIDLLKQTSGLDIKIQWWTALDERVRSSHKERHGKIYTRKKALTLIGEPNCRCTLLPYIKD